MPTKIAVPAQADSYRLSIGSTGVTYLHFLTKDDKQVGSPVFLLAERTPGLFQEPVSSARILELPTPREIADFILDSAITSMEAAGLRRSPDIDRRSNAA